MRDRKGLLRKAHRGVLFLDEIGELGTEVQAILLTALESGQFLPVGEETPIKSDFILIAGTNKDLREEVIAGRFREDLLARLNLWTFALPRLADRPEDLEPNLDFELAKFSEKEGRVISMNREARNAFLKFAITPEATWPGNFRDLNAVITRMGTLAPKGRIQKEQVTTEVQLLQKAWDRDHKYESSLQDLEVPQMDSFDRVQLEHVIKVCRESKTMGEAGRKLFSESRKAKQNPNDSDRIRKYLARFGLSFQEL